MEGLKEFVQQKKLNNRLELLKQWLVKREYKEDHLIQKLKE